MAALEKVKCLCGREYPTKFKECPKCREPHPAITAKKEGIKKRQKELALADANRNKIKCLNCGFIGNSEKLIKGTFGVEVVLWLFFLIPGLIYSIWRLTTQCQGCPECRWEHVAPYREQEKNPV